MRDHDDDKASRRVSRELSDFKRKRWDAVAARRDDRRAKLNRKRDEERNRPHEEEQ